MARFTDLTGVSVITAPGDGAAEAVQKALKESGLPEYVSTTQARGFEVPEDVLNLVNAKPSTPTPAVTRTGTAATDTKGVDVLAEGWVVWAAVGSLVIGFAIATWLHQPSFTPAASFNAFAVMYIVAQAIERLLDPVTPFLGIARPADQGKDAKGKDPHRIDQPTAKGRRDQAVADALTNPSKDAAEKAAKAQRTVDQIRANLTLLMWGVSSMLAMLASGLLGLYLLKTVGLTNVPTAVDIAVTGLAIGAGTKPLHDLISNMSATKTKQDPAQTR